MFDLKLAMPTRIYKEIGVFKIRLYKIYIVCNYLVEQLWLKAKVFTFHKVYESILLYDI